MTEKVNNNDDAERKKLLSGEDPFGPSGGITLSKITEGYPEDPRTDEDLIKSWINTAQLFEDEDFSEDITMIGEHNFWKQREPSSVAKINAEVKNVTRELNEVTAEKRRVAEIRYGKTHGISQKDAGKILSQDSALLQEWINY